MTPETELVPLSRYIQPSAFYTFDPIRIDVDNIINSIEKSMDGEHEELIEIMGENNALSNLKQGKKSNYDRATTLFVSILDWQENGSAPIPLDRDNVKERIGRFPTSDGNSIKYLLDNTSDEDHESKLHELLIKLMKGLLPENLGYKEYDKGVAGLELMGWINSDEVSELKNTIQKGRWIVSAKEPYDGGVQEIFRNLVKLLKSAERRNCGILMRKHS